MTTLILLIVTVDLIIVGFLAQLFRRTVDDITDALEAISETVQEIKTDVKRAAGHELG